MSPSERGAETRRRIVEAAIAEIAEKGWGAVRVRDVAARADVNLALVHYHCGSKEALMLAALDEALAAESEAPVDALTAAGGPAEALEGLFAAALAIDMSTPTARVLHEAMLVAVRDPDVAAHMRPALEGFRTLAAGALRTGDGAPGADDEAVAIGVAALVDGLVLHLLLDPDLPRERVARALADRLAGPGGGAR